MKFFICQFFLYFSIIPQVVISIFYLQNQERFMNKKRLFDYLSFLNGFVEHSNNKFNFGSVPKQLFITASIITKSKIVIWVPTTTYKNNYHKIVPVLFFFRYRPLCYLFFSLLFIVSLPSHIHKQLTNICCCFYYFLFYFHSNVCFH